MARKVSERMVLKQFFIQPSLFKKLRAYADFHCLSASEVIRLSIESFVLQSDWARGAVQMEVSK